MNADNYLNKNSANNAPDTQPVDTGYEFRLRGFVPPIVVDRLRAVEAASKLICLACDKYEAEDGDPSSGSDKIVAVEAEQVVRSAGPTAPMIGTIGIETITNRDSQGKSVPIDIEAYSVGYDGENDPTFMDRDSMAADARKKLEDIYGRAA